MSTLERLSDARGTVEGKIVAIVLAVLLVMPVVGVTAFADSEADHDHGTPAADVVETSVVKELPDTGNQPISEVAEPEQPAAPTVVPEEPAEEPADADEVRLGLDVDEGAALVYDGKAYGVADGYFVVPAGQDATFTVRLGEGVALADDEPVVLKAADGSKDELVAVDGIYTIQAGQLAEGLTVAVAVAGVEGDAAADEAVVDETSDWAAATEAKTITSKNWCTNMGLGSTEFSTEGYPGLNSASGMNPASFAETTIAVDDGRNYRFHHAEVQPQDNQQTNNTNDNKFGQYEKVISLRYNQRASDWEYQLAGQAGTWVEQGDAQLVFYYRYEKQLSDEGDTVLTSKDWPWTEAEYVSGKYIDVKGELQNVAGSDNCVTVYQLYSSTGDKMEDGALRTYIYSHSIDREENTLSVAKNWAVEDVCIVPLPNMAPTKKQAFSYDAPGTYGEVCAMDGANKAVNPNSFNIPWATTWNKQYRASLVAVKIKAEPSEETLYVKYLDDKDEVELGSDFANAKKPDGADKPSWEEYVSIREGKAEAKDGYAGPNGAAAGVKVPTEINGDSMYPLSFMLPDGIEGYTQEHVRAELDGNTLKLYFAKVYGVSYEWSGLDLDGVDKVVDSHGQKVAGLPHDDGKYLAGAEYQVSAVHKLGDKAYAVKDGKVTAVYRFSGWKLNGELATGTRAMPEGGVTLVGTWEALTASYKGTVSVEGQIYDGTSDYTETLKTTLTDPTNPDENSEPSRYIYKDEDGKELDGAPVDAGDYTVTAVWDATDKRPEVVSGPCKFTISKREVKLISKSASKPYDGVELKMPNVTVEDDSGVFNNEAEAVAEGVALNAGDEVENTISVSKKTEKYNENNYVITYITGTLKVTDAVKIVTDDVTKKYDGQGASIQASTDEGWTLWYSTDEGDNKTWSTENPVSREDVGTYVVYVKATRDGYAEVGPVSAKVTITPAPVTIRVADASKVAGTDDPVFRGTIEGEVARRPLSGVTYFRSNDAEGVGVYANVLTATYDENPNYAVTIDPGTFTITAMALPDNPPTPGPIDTIIDFLSTPIIGGTPGADGPMVNIADDGTPLANIDDNDTPLAAFDHPLCWVHYYILLGIIITAIYGGGVIARRLNYNRKVKGYEDDVTGKSRDGEEAKRPVAVPTQA